MQMTEEFQAELVDLINADDPQEVVSITTTSAGLNAVAQAIDWHPGDNVAFCEIEFPSNAYPWMSLACDGVETRLVTAVNGGLTLSALQEVIDEHTRVVAASAIQFFSGHRTDLTAIGQFCQQRGILFVVDAIQAIGHMHIDVAAMGIDALACGGQKSIMAAPGSGFLYVRNDVAETMQPRFIGGNATEDFLHWLAYDLTPRPGAQRFQMGTQNIAGMFGVLESVRLLKELGIDNIDHHTTHLTAVARITLTNLDYELITPSTDNGPITTFKTGLDESATDALVTYLQDNQITVVKHLDAAGTPHIRLAFHCFNTEAEIAQFAQVMGSRP